MEVFRISHQKHSKKLTSSGAANRWNKKNEFVIYTSASRSLSTLELVVHRNSISPNPNYEVMNISLPDDEELYEQILIKDLPKNWRKFNMYYKLQEIGSEWYRNNRSLILKVPSAVIEKEFNYIINTNHPLFEEKVKLVRNEAYFFDGRLF
ncbi:RES family NAD+ phosphorylase [Brumimicrobium aurantiacum]|uniref:RES domain-containing protein n=1 Tax=Brumimicrobium aurantiacum TaxID=1737063 RepID=A0A3E1EZR2_9FLAO|nr:RES family NAD+ phosphorylase [Brumimicrobium aurantiacum]RFC55062.1 RES domain-containing protein [Brumimicrobium aurantiacum]